MAAPRRLAYRDRFVWELEQVVSDLWDDCDGLADPYIFPDMTTRIPFVMLLSQEQFTTLYSAVLTGADLTYPNTSHDVENLFLQIVNCPMNEFCVAMINCLENNPDTLAALQALLAENGLTGGVGDPYAPLSETITGENLLPAGYTCTDDKAFGMALAVVESINDATTEVLQAIEVLTNPVELAAELGDNIPGVGALSSAGDVARWIQDSAKEQYDLAWSTTVRDELACLLWCEFKGGCSLTFDSIWDTYLGAANVSPPGGVLLTDWLAWLIALPFVASLSTVASISLLGLLAMRYGGSFGDFELGIRSLETVINLAQDDSSSDWSTVCDPCILTWCYNFDFLTTDGSWTNQSVYARPFGVWVSGEGWESVWGEVASNYDERLYIMRQFDDAITTSVEMRFKATGVGGDNRSANITVRRAGVPQGSVTFEDFPIDGTIQTLLLDEVNNIDEILATIVSDSDNDGDCEIHIVSVECQGTGTTPFGADNC